MQLLQMFQSGGNPFTIMRQFAGNDREKLAFIDNLEKQTPQQWEQIARNLAQSKGTTIENVINNIKNLQRF